MLIETKSRMGIFPNSPARSSSPGWQKGYLAEGLAPLERERTITDEQREATRAAIWYKIGLHFETFVLDEHSLTVAEMKAWPLYDKEGPFEHP